MKNKTFWMTGLSGAGKSTLAEKIKENYPQMILLDGDVLRKGLCSDLGFSDEDRKENMRRLIALCNLLSQHLFHHLKANVKKQKMKLKLARLFIVILLLRYVRNEI